MPQYIADWLLGPDLSVVQAYPSSPDGSGNFVDVTPFADITGVIRRLGHTVGTTLKNVRPSTTAQDNMVPVSYGTRCSLTALKTRNNYAYTNVTNSQGQLLRYLRANGTHVHLFWQEGRETEDGYFVMGDLESGIDGNEEQPESLALEPVALNNRAQVIRTTNQALRAPFFGV